MNGKGMAPRARIAQECARRGKDSVVQACVTLLRRGEADLELVLVLGGPGARPFLAGESRDDDYWLRVWALRGLLWAWDDAALPAVQSALSDEAWRVREMALKVVARHRLDAALLTVVDLQEDPTPRVRAAASRAMVRLSA